MRRNRCRYEGCATKSRKSPANGYERRGDGRYVPNSLSEYGKMDAVYVQADSGCGAYVTQASLYSGKGQLVERISNAFGIQPPEISIAVDMDGAYWGGRTAGRAEEDGRPAGRVAS